VPVSFLRNTSKQQRAAGLLPAPKQWQTMVSITQSRINPNGCGHACYGLSLTCVAVVQEGTPVVSQPAMHSERLREITNCLAACDICLCSQRSDQLPWFHSCTILGLLRRASSMRTPGLLYWVLLLGCVLSCRAFTWEPCDADKVPFIPDHVDLVPDPPAAGGQVVFKIQGNAGKVSEYASACPEACYQLLCWVCAHSTLMCWYLCITTCAVHDVPSGLISINVSFAGTQIYEEVDDLCSKTSCPIKTGPLDITYVQDLPPIAPPVSSCDSSLQWMYSRR
jgi:hypothetical protein